MSNNRLLKFIFQFLRGLKVFIEPNTRCPFIMQVSSALYSGDVWEKFLQYLHAQLNNIIHKKEDDTTEKELNHKETRTGDDDKTRKLLTTLYIRISEKWQLSGTENFQKFLISYHYAALDLKMVVNNCLKWFKYFLRKIQWYFTKTIERKFG